jgi:hypothetical protein
VQIREGSMAKSLLGISLEKGARAPQAQTGLAPLDELAQDAGIVSIERPYIRLQNADKAAASGVDRWFMFSFEEVENLPALADEFAALEDVQEVSLDWRAYPMVTPSDPYYTANWGHNNTAQLPGLDWGGTYDHTLTTTVGTVGFDANAPQAWDASQAFGSASIVIAIIDSGVDMEHTDIRKVTGYDFGDNDTNPDDNATGAGHGTCCAGVAAAMNNGVGAVGVAAGCSIMPLKVANSAGSMFFSAIQNALYYAADNGADIVSMSLGAAISTDAATNTAIQYAYNAGCTILAATGNENMTVISYPGHQHLRDRRRRGFAVRRPQAQLEPVNRGQPGRQHRPPRLHLRRRALVGIELRRDDEGRRRRRGHPRPDDPADLRHRGLGRLSHAATSSRSSTAPVAPRRTWRAWRR